MEALVHFLWTGVSHITSLVSVSHLRSVVPSLVLAAIIVHVCQLVPLYVHLFAPYCSGPSISHSSPLLLSPLLTMPHLFTRVPGVG
jgi:hypothetical protein